MAALVLTRDRGPAVRDGRQRIALAAPRGAAHSIAAVGQPVHIDLAGSKTHKRERVAVRDCILRATVVIGPTALVRVIGLSFRVAPGESLSRLLTNAENGAPGNLDAARLQLAKAAGFRSWKALYEWNAGHSRRGRPDADGRVTRELIGWGV